MSRRHPPQSDAERGARNLRVLGSVVVATTAPGATSIGGWRWMPTVRRLYREDELSVGRRLRKVLQGNNPTL